MRTPWYSGNKQPRHLRLQRAYADSKWFRQQHVATVPPLKDAGDDDLVAWIVQVLTNVYVAEPAPAPSA